MSDRPPLTYRDAGVDIAAGSALVERIKPAAKRTLRPEVIGGLGGFGALIDLPRERYRNPVLVATTDGVGTKLRLAFEHDAHELVGIDLVAMNVNDLVVQGAEPLFFLDYYATGRLDVDIAARVIDGIATGCVQAGCALVGGETAEMPGMYQAGDYDLAGFCVGVVERTEILDGWAVRGGDIVLGMASSGPHSNGFSLIRRIIDGSGADLDQPLGGQPLRQALLAPTRIYVKAALALRQHIEIHALAHITGGGLPENLPRVMPRGTMARIDTTSWPRPPVFQWLQETGNVSPAEMLRTFNCGIGMCAILPPSAVNDALAVLNSYDITAYPIGQIESSGNNDPPRIEL